MSKVPPYSSSKGWPHSRVLERARCILYADFPLFIRSNIPVYAPRRPALGGAKRAADEARIYGGGYDWVASGHFRPMGLIASTDIMVWQPQKGTFYVFRKAGGVDGYQADLLGRFYSPLILLYQKVFAPPIRTVLADGSCPNPSPRLPDRKKLHPNLLKQMPEAEKTFGMTWEQIQAKAATQ